MSRNMYTPNGVWAIISRHKPCEDKKNGKFFKSLRFRILIILIILGIVPSVIVTEMVIANYEDRAIANRVQSMENICDIMCDLLIKENYLNDSSSQT